MMPRSYETLQSGVPNFICLSLALLELGHKPRGIRLDSGDLAYLSKEARKMFREVATRYNTVEKYDYDLAKAIIVASNDVRGVPRCPVDLVCC